MPSNEMLAKSTTPLAGRVITPTSPFPTPAVQMHPALRIPPLPPSSSSPNPKTLSACNGFENQTSKTKSRQSQSHRLTALIWRYLIKIRQFCFLCVFLLYRVVVAVLYVAALRDARLYCVKIDTVYQLPT